MSTSAAAASSPLKIRSTSFKSFTVEDILRKDPVNTVRDGPGQELNQNHAIIPHSHRHFSRGVPNKRDDEEEEEEVIVDEGKTTTNQIPSGNAQSDQSYSMRPNAQPPVSHQQQQQHHARHPVLSHHYSPVLSPSSCSEGSLAGLNGSLTRSSRSCLYYPNHHHQRVNQEHHHHASSSSPSSMTPHPSLLLQHQPKHEQDQGIGALQQFYHQHQSNSHYFTNRQPVISGVSYGNLHGQRSVVVPGSSHFPSQSSPFSMHHPINLQASSMGPHRHHAPSSPDHHQSLHELNIISKRSNGSGSPPDSIGSSQQQPVHPIFAVSPSSGITYSWISPPKSLPRKRTVFSRTQRTSLESKFQSQKYISKSERIRFARELGLKDSQVKVWFINRRTKWRNDREKKLMSSSGSKSKAGSVSSCSTTSSTTTC